MEQYDVVIVGAGFSGLYALHHFRDDLGLSACVLDGAGGVGGTWWYNRYPGARVDAPSAPFYAYTFSDELVQSWDWPETQTSQASVLDYLNHVADRFDLRRDICLNSRVERAQYDESAQCWRVSASTGKQYRARFLVCALGALFVAHKPDYPGIDDFAGPCYHTGRWPHEPVSFAGKRVGVIGTGSSGVQAIPEIARQAAQVTVFQRTPQFTLPARNRRLAAEELTAIRAGWSDYRERMLANPAGMPFPVATRRFADDTPAQRQQFFETLWEEGGAALLMKGYRDTLTSAEANAALSDFVRAKIRAIVNDPETAASLMPDYFIGTKRIILDNGYFETYNRDNVQLVDLRRDPIQAFHATGVRTQQQEIALDALVLATGYDAVTGSMLGFDVVGRGGQTLRQKWSARFDTNLGVAVAGFPNLFMMHGPGSPGVFFNMPLGSERQAQWIGACMTYTNASGHGAIETSAEAETAWDAEIEGIAGKTLYPQTDSWYLGANVPGKPRQFLGHLNGARYHQHLPEVAALGYAGFSFEARMS